MIYTLVEIAVGLAVAAAVYTTITRTFVRPGLVIAFGAVVIALVHLWAANGRKWADVCEDGGWALPKHVNIEEFLKRCGDE